MSNPLSVIRWKFVIPVGILLAAIIVFFVMFFDPLMERAFERVGSKVNGAKVEIDGFKTKFARGRVDITRLQITDRKAPMRNVLETGAMSFQLSPAEAIKKRFIINTAEMHGLQFDTERKTSGAIPKLAKRDEKDGPPGPAERLAAKYKDRFKLNLAGIKNEVKGRIEFDPKDTQIVKLSNELTTKADVLPKEWDTRVNTLDAENRLKKISDDLESIKNTKTNGPEAITAIPGALKKLKESRDALQKLKEETQATKTSITTDIKAYKDGVASLPTAKKADVDNLMSRLNLDFADPTRFMEGIIGPMVLQRFQTVMKYVEIARKHMPSKKEKESVVERPRATGLDVTFPTPAAMPRVWLMKAALDGVYEGITASGGLSNLTTDPARAGQPFKMDLSGARGTQKYDLRAVLDHVGEISKDSFAVKATGFDLAKIAGSGAGDVLAGGQAAGDIAFSVIGEGNLGGNIAVTMTGVKLDRAYFLKEAGVEEGATNLSTEDAFKASFLNNVVKSVETMPEVTVNAQLFGTWTDPSMKLSSNLTGALAGVIKSTLGNAINEQRAQLEGRLNEVMNKEKAKLDAKAAELQGKVDARINKVQADIDKKVAEATGINLTPAGGSPVKIPSLDKLFK